MLKNIWKNKHMGMSVEEARDLTTKGKASVIQREFNNIIVSIKSNASNGFTSVTMVGEPYPENKIRLESLGYEVIPQKISMMNKNDTIISWEE